MFDLRIHGAVIVWLVLMTTIAAQSIRPANACGCSPYDYRPIGTRIRSAAASPSAIAAHRLLGVVDRAA